MYSGRLSNYGPKRFSSKGWGHALITCGTGPLNHVKIRSSDTPSLQTSGGAHYIRLLLADRLDGTFGIVFCLFSHQTVTQSGKVFNRLEVMVKTLQKLYLC